MKIKENDNLPNSEIFVLQDGEPVKKNIEDFFKDKKVVIFGLPGAYTSVCSAKHLPGYIKMHDQYKEKGIDHIICISVNDPFVMSKWGETTGASSAGIRMLADPASDFTKSIGTEFTVPPIGFFNRSKRCAFIVENQTIVYAYLDDASGVVTGSSAEAVLLKLQDS